MLTLVALALTVLVLGLVIDVGQMFVVEKELQSYVDGAALRAAYELDGSRAGLERARRVVKRERAALVQHHRFSFAAPGAGQVHVAFARRPEGNFERRPPAGSHRRFVRVAATATVKLWLLPVLPGVAIRHPVAASAVAGQVRLQAAGEGLAPFSPAARDPQASDFGFRPGQSYRLSGRGAGARGYLDVGQRRDPAGAEDAVLNTSYYRKRPLGQGSEVHYLAPPANLAKALGTRFHQDTDTSSATYPAYAARGNGRRILVTPVNDGGNPPLVVGFATFLEQAGACPGRQGPCRATYVGNAPVLHGKGNGAGGPGLYEVVLVR